MNRIDRISAILIQLQSRRVVKANDIAQRFNISLRTVYRDVKTLEEAGIPIIGEAGVGYSLMEGYRLPPVMFTREEATAFLTAEKFVEKLTDNSTRNSHRSAMDKIRAILKTAEKDMLEDMDSKILVLKHIENPQVPDNGYIQAILSAIMQKMVVGIEYFAHHSQQTTRREVEPIGIFFLEGFWHLVAYCRLRDDYRDFRIDRIKKLSVTEKHFTSEHPTLKSYITQTAKDKKMARVVIRVDKSVYPNLSHQKYYSGFVSETEIDGFVEMTFLTISIEGFARWFMMFGDMAEIVEPAELRDKVIALTDGLLQRNATMA
jgi:predicted DNA-binding transcriptional regulator YafY